MTLLPTAKRLTHGASRFTFHVSRFSLVALIVGCTTPAPVNTGSSAPPASPTVSVAALDPCASGAAKLSTLEAATATAAPAQPQPTPATPPPPTPTPRPAPQVDRVGYPEGYQQNFKLLYVYDRTVTNQVRVACGNDVAASAKPGEPYPRGSIILFESWRPKSQAGTLARDANNRLIREELTTIFVMRKETGFGEAYQERRNGEWEYVAYRPDKSVQTSPANSAACAACHLVAKDRDFVFRSDLQFKADHYGATVVPGPNEVTIDSGAFQPGPRSVRVGTTVTWKNTDIAPHTVVARDSSFTSQPLAPGASFTFTFSAAGAFDYFCSLHPESMSGARITVTS